MSGLQVVAELAVGARADLVYRLIADFDAITRGCCRCRATFFQFRVEEAGVGAGTVHSFRMTAAGGPGRSGCGWRSRSRGQVLTGPDESSSMVMTWVVAPEGPGCRVRVETGW